MRCDFAKEEEDGLNNLGCSNAAKVRQAAGRISAIAAICRIGDEFPARTLLGLPAGGKSASVLIGQATLRQATLRQATLNGQAAMENQSVTAWIDQLAGGDQQAAEQLWQHVSLRLQEFARRRLDGRTRRGYDEHDAANSAFHSLCRGLAEGRIEAENRDAFWGLLAVITTRKIAAQRRYLNRQKRGAGLIRGESGFGELGDGGINVIVGNQTTPQFLAEVSESCAQLLDSLSDESMKKIVLLKFQGMTNGETASEMGCTRRTIERKLERIRRIWVEAGLLDDEH